MAYVVGRTRHCILIALFLCAGVWLQACANTAEYVEEGRTLGSAGQWDKSVDVLQKAQEENPSDPEIKLMLARAKSNASMKHMAQGETLLRRGSFDKAIREFRLSINFNPGNVRAEVLLRRAKAFQESNVLFGEGKKFLQKKEYAKARRAFQTAVKLNPANKEAENALAAYRKEMERPPRFRLKPKTTAPVSLRFKKTPITNVFEVLSRLSGVNFIFDKDIKETKVTLFMTDVPIVRFLEVLLRTNNLAGKLVNDKTMIIYPNTPAKIKEYEDLQIRTFYLTNLQVKKAVALLAKILKSNDIIANEKLNALVIRGPKELIEVASKLIEANDRPPAEVLLNVEILEVSRSKERQLGLDVNPTSITFGIGETSPVVNKDSAFAPNVSAYALGKITNKEFLLSLPQATLNLLKQDAGTRTLASPQIRVRNGEKATIHVGERVPLRVNRRIDTTGVVTNDYQYQDIGVKVNAEPVVNRNDEVSLKLGLEVSALGANLGTADEPQYSIKTRKASSVLTIRDGEPVIIGGLISDEERKTVRKIPLLGDIPVIGYLFSNLDKSKVETDILMSITPIIIRSQDIPAREVSEIWSGKERDFSLKEPYDSYAERKDRYYDRPKNVRDFAGKSAPEGLQKAVGTMRDDTPPKVSAKGAEPIPRKQLPVKIPPGKVMQPVPSPARMTQVPAAPNPQGKKEQSEAQRYFWPGTVRYSIHVNSYPTRVEAEVRLRKLSQEKFDCFLVPVNIPGMGFFYRVFVGRFRDYRSASSMCNVLKGKRGFASDIHVANRRWAFGG
ncbi:MAG: SPOR domain-containing protein [Deltaproteobacteria bacterium]|nr:SPOR domain-containing protein [Deltaproteobacteria bacterium]